MKPIPTLVFISAVIGAGTAPYARASEAPLRLTASRQLPTIDSSFERWDICQQVDDFIDSLGMASSILPHLCNQEMSQSFGLGVAAATIHGTLEQLVVHDGTVHVDGPVDITMELSPLVIEGGRAPSFAPCDRGNFPGCIRPDLQSFVSFVDAVVPALDVNVPTPESVCVPGTPIVTRRATRAPGRWIPGHWSGWTWYSPRFVPGKLIPPAIEVCKVTDFGELPTVTPPQVQEVFIDTFPHVTADMGVTVAGDGAIDIEIPVPYAGAKLGYGNSWLDLDLSAGVSLVLSLAVEDAGADAFLSFDEYLHVRSHYVRGQGWTQTAEVLENTVAPALIPHEAGVTIRAGLKLGLEATAQATLGSDGDESDDSASSNRSTGEDESDAPDHDGSDDTEAESPELDLPQLPVDDSVQCAAEWITDGAALDLGLETKAELVLFVEGTFGTSTDGTFDTAVGAEFTHAEALSLPGLCEIDCASLAGDDNPACGTVELFRQPIGQL